tara:strand:- start:26 stop:697 length:672 start_codon:yes stop_codon:yes gene_type:complete
MIYCFGDSWGYGAELDFDAGEKPFVELFDEQAKNFSVSGQGLPMITQNVLQNHNLIKKWETVFVVIPPDTRWYTENKGDFRNLTIHSDKYIDGYTSKKYMDFVSDKTSFWFMYHANLFVYTIQSIFDGIGCKYMFMHNYGGEFTIHRDFSELIKVDKFLDIKNSLTSLLSSEDGFTSWKSDGPQKVHESTFTGKYFEGNKCHPNQLGHYRIKELIEDAFRQRT